MEIQVEASAPGALVIQRAFLPLYRATVDGENAPIVAANVHRLGIELSEGEHTVEVWVDRRPFRVSSGIALIGVVLLLALTWRLGRSREVAPTESVQALGQ